jgi:hypothetical protein
MTEDTGKVEISKENLDYYGQLTDEATAEYYNWLKQILMLAAGSLTVLVSLRNQILPEAPKAIYLLQLSWILFAVTIVLALFALRGHHILLFNAARDLFKTAIGKSDVKAGMVEAPKIYSIFGQVTPWVLVSAVLSLTLFGILNLGYKAPQTIEAPKTQITIPKNIN